MKAAIIGASIEAVHTIQKAKEHGLKVVALDGNEKAEGLKLAHKSVVVDISKEEEVISCLKEEKVDFILTPPIGRYLSTIGAANDFLKLPGIGKKETILCTDKFLFHETLNKEALRNVHCYLLGEEKKDREKLFQKLKEEKLTLSFPVLLKPRYGSGSRGIFFVNSLEELKQDMEKCLGEEYLLEEYVDGEEYGLDGAIIDNTFYLILLRHKKNTPLPYRQAVAYFSVSQEDPFYQEVDEFMKKTVSILHLNECLFHADLVAGEKGIFLIELSARPSGHNLHNIFTPLCTGVDMAEEYIKYRMGKEYNFHPVNTKKMMIHYFDMEGKVNRIPKEEEIEKIADGRLCSFVCNLTKNEELGTVCNGHSLMTRGYFILSGEAKEDMLEKAEKIKNCFTRIAEK